MRYVKPGSTGLDVSRIRPGCTTYGAATELPLKERELAEPEESCGPHPVAGR